MDIGYWSELKLALKSVTVEHRNFVQAKHQLFAMASLAEPPSVIVFTGPSRVGKGTVRKWVVKQLISETTDDAFQPVAVVEGANAVDGLFSMKHLTLRALDAYRHPFFQDPGPKSAGYTPRIRLHETQLRILLERTIRHRRGRWLFVEEAGHLVIARSAVRAANVLDSLKSLGNETNIILILIGGYALADNLFHSAHFSARLRIITFKEYKDVSEDRDHYANALLALNDFVPLARGHKLLDFEDVLFYGSVGRVGFTVQWLESALAAMAADGRRTLTKQYLTATLVDQQVTDAKNDIARGEELLTRNGEIDVSVSEKPSTERAGNRRTGFKRNVVRDRVGGNTSGKS